MAMFVAGVSLNFFRDLLFWFVGHGYPTS